MDENYKFDETRMNMYRSIASEETIERYRIYGFAPPPYGYTGKWPPKTTDERKRALDAIQQVLKEGIPLNIDEYIGDIPTKAMTKRDSRLEKLSKSIFGSLADKWLK